MGIQIEKKEEVGKNGQRGDEEIRTLCYSKVPLLGCVTLFNSGHWRFYYLCGPCYTPSKTFHCPVSGLSTKENPPNFWEIGYSSPLTQLNSIVLFFISTSQELLWLIINKRVQGIRGLHCQCQDYIALLSSPDRSDSMCVIPPLGRSRCESIASLPVSYEWGEGSRRSVGAEAGSRVRSPDSLSLGNQELKTF